MVTGQVEVNEITVEELSVIADYVDGGGFDPLVQNGLVDSVAGYLYCYANVAGGFSCTFSDDRALDDYCSSDGKICEISEAGHDYCVEHMVGMVEAHCNLGCCDGSPPERNSCNAVSPMRRECDYNLAYFYPAVYVRGEDDAISYTVKLKCSDDGLWYPPCVPDMDEMCPFGSRCVDSDGPSWGEGLDGYGYCMCGFAGVELACDDGLDNDNDGFADCRDIDCHWYSNKCSEICGDGLDNDGDCLVDCYDPECTYERDCNALSESDCGDGTDNDYDLDIDCKDETCSESPDCVEICDNGIDDDRDGKTDCSDYYCRLNEMILCPTENDAGMSPPKCNDDIDNDGDGFIDCDDLDCLGNRICPPPESELNCNDGIDNDDDEYTDCEDSDCFSETCEEVCFDNRDNDLDGLIDTFDPDCQDHPACTGIEPDCANGLDDDYDDLVDCDDPSCAGDPACD
jgi:hypothetical protein